MSPKSFGNFSISHSDDSCVKQDLKHQNTRFDLVSVVCRPSEVSPCLDIEVEVLTREEATRPLGKRVFLVRSDVLANQNQAQISGVSEPTRFQNCTKNFKVFENLSQDYCSTRKNILKFSCPEAKHSLVCSGLEIWGMGP